MAGVILMLCAILTADSILDTLGAYGLVSILIFAAVLSYAGLRRRRLWL